MSRTAATVLVLIDARVAIELSKEQRMRPSLRLFTGDDTTAPVDPPTVTMTIGEFCRILREADRFDSTWLQDFEDDDVTLPLDLYEVMTTYWALKPGA